MENKKWIFLRGLTRGNGHWGDFPDVLKHLDSEVDFELLEIPGNGTRNNELTPISAEEVIASIRCVSRIVKENKKFNLMGISLGGMLGLKWAELFPEEIERLIVINASLSQFSTTSKRLQLTQLPKFVTAIGTNDVCRRESIMLQIISSCPEKHKKSLKKSIEFSNQYPIQFSNFVRQLLLAKLIKVNTVNQLNQLNQVKILCSKADALVHYSCSQEIAKHFSLNIAIHPTAGHDLSLDAPEWVAKQILDID